MEVRVLGPLEVVTRGRTLDIRGRRQRSLLAILIARANDVVSPDTLIDELWPDEPPPSAAKTLQAHISRLRDMLEAPDDDEALHLQTHGHGYRLVVGPDQLDVRRFERLVEAGRHERAAGDPKAAAATLRRALDLWRGPAYAEFEGEPFAEAEIGRLDEIRLAATEDRFEADLELGRHRELIPELEAFVGREPLRERARGQLMTAMYRSGRQAEALRVYQEGRRQLADDLGVEPSETLQDLERRILRQDPDLAARRAPTLVASGQGRTGRVRWAVLTAALLVGAFVGAAAWAVAGPKPRTDGAGVAVLSAASGEMIGNVTFGSTPSHLAVGVGSVWVVDADDRTLTQVDLATKAVRRIFNTASTPTDVATGVGAVWLANADSRAPGAPDGSLLPVSVDRLDPRTGEIVATAPLPPTPAGHLYGVLPGLSRRHLAVTNEAVWVINADQTVSRIDPRSTTIAGTVTDIEARNIAAGEGQVWFTEDGAIGEIDQGTNRVRRRVEFEDAVLADIAIGAGSVWVTDPLDGAVWRVATAGDPKPKRIEVAPWVAGIAFGAGGVWVTSEIGDEVHRIDPTTDVPSLVAQPPSPGGIDASDVAVWVTAGSPPSRDAALPRNICSDIEYDGPGQPDLLVTSTLPLEGDARTYTVPMVDGIRFAFEQRGFKAGSYRVGYQSCDTATAQAAETDFIRCGSNAKAFARNLRVVGVIGAYESPCSYVQIPIANAAPGGPLMMLSPSNTDDDITTDEELYPSGVHNYARIASANRFEGGAHVQLVHRLGARSLAIVSSTEEEYGPGFTDEIRGMADELGVRIAIDKVADMEEEAPSAVASEIAASEPDAVIVVGILVPWTGDLLRELRGELGPEPPIVTPDGFALPEDLAELAGPAAEGLYTTVYGIPNSQLVGRGQRFLEDYERSRGRSAGPDLGAAYGAQAAEILIDAIGRSDGTRTSVTEKVLETSIDDGILGAIRFDENGDLIDSPTTVMRFDGETFVVDGVCRRSGYCRF